MSDVLLVEVADQVATVTLNRPDARNALNRELRKAIPTALLELDAPAHRFPARFGVTKVLERPEEDLAIYFGYEAAEGMDAQMADLVATRFLESLPPKHFPQFYINDVYRFLYACHLSRVGRQPPPWLVAEAEATAR